MMTIWRNETGNYFRLYRFKHYDLYKDPVVESWCFKYNELLFFGWYLVYEYK